MLRSLRCLGFCIFENFRLWLSPLFCSALSYSALAFSNSVSSHKINEIRSSIIEDNCLMILGGWLNSLWMYKGESLGFLYGQYLPEFRFNETSRKLTSWRFDSIVILNPWDLNIWISLYLSLSVCGSELKDFAWSPIHHLCTVQSQSLCIVLWPC